MEKISSFYFLHISKNIYKKGTVTKNSTFFKLNKKKLISFLILKIKLKMSIFNQIVKKNNVNVVLSQYTKKVTLIVNVASE
jgi:hypothetical protein